MIRLEKTPQMLIAVGAFLFLPLSLFAPMGTVIWLAVVAGGSYLMDRFQKDNRPDLPKYILPNHNLVFLGVFMIWGILGYFWSLTPEKSVDLTLKVSLLLLAGFYLKERIKILASEDKDRVLRFFLVGFTVCLFFMALELYWDAKILSFFAGKQVEFWRFNKFASLFGIVVWVVIQALVQRNQKLLAFFTYGVSFILLFTLDSESTTLGFLFGGLAWILVYFLRRRMLYVLSVFTFLSALSAPLFPTYVFNPDVLREPPLSSYALNSLLHRFYVWEFARDKALERPVTGWGLASSRDKSFRTHIRWEVPKEWFGETWKDDVYISEAEAIPNHPHNAFLQFWFELGIPGVLWVALFLASIPLFIQRHFKDRVVRASATGALATGMITANMAYGIWQNWWVCGFLISGALFHLFFKASPPESSSGLTRGSAAKKV